MGCTCSAEIDRTAEEDLVGGVGRTSKQVNYDEIPEDRRPMVALEVLASRRTVYRKKMRKYEPCGDLDYNKSNKTLHLRNLLDEPVGRFYLNEFAHEKKLPEMADLVAAWVAVHALSSPKDVSLRDVLEQAEADEAVDAATNAAIATGVATDKMKNVPNENLAVSDKAERDLYHDREWPTEEEILDAGREIVETYLTPDAEHFLGPSLGNEECEDVAAACNAALEEASVSGVQSSLLRTQNDVFRVLMDKGFYSKFREHSEYKRYKMKFARVYNTISHRDFDYMATLGKGSFGRVLRVRKKTTGAQFALKVMSKKKILNGAESADQVTIERNVVVTCDCPSIVRPEFSFQTSRALFLALELLEGGTLLDAMHANGGTLRASQIRFIAAEVALGLEHMHKHGILYRDLKPVNIMLDAKGHAVLTDMGLCAKIRPSSFPKEEGALSSSGNRLLRRKSMTILKPEELKCVGTFGFRAPELLEASESKTGYGPAVDYWSLGVTIYYLYAGKLPFQKRAGRKSLLGGNANPKDAERRLHKEITLAPDTPEDLASAVFAFLEKDPSDRLGSDPDELRAHDFFAKIDFDKLARRELSPVYKPHVPSRKDDEEPLFAGLADAMMQFSQDNVLELFGGENEMQDEYVHVGRSQQRLFREWDYVPDELLAPDWQLCGEDRLFP
ncbi:Protein kinase, putative [Hondaea fermentalgiana]|uniref:Protein kinase, putative n=1 Tax=Hondaea fermentalgiana TaxID=2315210 RepID=A0A2R5GH29_9STRA|nr:Protein kinase, putative [Hondaea fermentalgiana]|eukprot:GBG30197.1 Protein kinase, putative [Hondaea fermentalgiana]